MTKSKYRHTTIMVETILNWSQKELVKNYGLMESEGVCLSPIQMYNLANKAKIDGYTVIPMCDNHDSRGYCLGHEEKEEQ